MPSARPRIRNVTLDLRLTVVGIDSNYDFVTSAALDYRERHVYPYLQSKGFRIKKFQGPLARRHYVAPESKKPEVVYVTGAGHGLHNLFSGDQGNIIFEVGNYHPDEVNAKIVHFLSCRTGRQLATDFVANGCRAYFGYDEDFTYPVADRDTFFECDSEIDRAFADGLSAAQVYERVKKLYDRRITELRAAGKLYAAATLEFDRDHLRCPSSGGANWGDSKAKLT